MNEDTRPLHALLVEHTRADEARFDLIDQRIGSLEKKIARGAFLGVVVGQAVAQGAVHIGDVLALLGAS